MLLRPEGIHKSCLFRDVNKVTRPTSPLQECRKSLSMRVHEICKWFWRSTSSLCQNDQTVGQQRENRTGKTPTLFREKPTAAVQALTGQEQSQLAKDKNLQQMHTPINPVCP